MGWEWQAMRMETWTEQEQANVRHVRAMFDQVLNALDAEAAHEFIDREYIQHNQAVGQGLEPLQALLRRIRSETPQAVHDIKRIFADADHVIVHYHVRRWPQDRGWAVVDIFRLSGGMIVEHWDVVQDVPEDSPNPLGPF